MRILCMGDSNTYGYDPRSYLGDRYPAEVRWTDNLGDREALNCGMNGLTIPWDATPYFQMIQRENPDLVLVMLGSNDLLEGAGAETAARCMERFLVSVKRAGVPILLLAPPPMQAGAWVQDAGLIEASKKLATAYRELAAKIDVSFADAGTWNVELCFDGVHFSPRGHAAFARELTEILQKT